MQPRALTSQGSFLWQSNTEVAFFSSEPSSSTVFDGERGGIWFKYETRRLLAILVATARKLQRVEAISVQHRYRQIAVARNSVQRSNEVPHKDIAYGTPADAALI